MILPVYVSMSTIPSRLERAKKNIIKSADANKNMIFILNVSNSYKRFSEKIDNFKINRKNIIVNFTKDLGPVTKLIGPFEERLIPQDSILIICDDDEYHPEAFEILAGYQQRDLFTVHTYYDYLYNNIKVPQGVDMISFYTPLLSDFPSYSKEKLNSCFLVDDLMIAGYLKSKGIQIKTIPRQWKWPWIPDSTDSGLFKETDRDSLMDNCYKNL